MKKDILLLSFLIMTVGNMFAQSPKWLKKARNAQVSIIAYDDKGQMHEAEGTILSTDGIILTEYDVLKHANQAKVIDYQGNEYNVTEIAGANAMYNVAKLQIEPGKNKLTALQPAEQSIAVGEQIFIMPHSKADKSAPCKSDTIAHAEQFNGEFNYYSLTHNIGERSANCPVMTQDGQFIGLLQLSAKEGGNSFVIDYKFIMQLRINALDAGNSDLAAIEIPKSLPDSEEDANTFIFLTKSKNSKHYKEYIDRFILKYPNSTNGYIMKAEYFIDQNDYAQAASCYEEALSNTSLKKDELLYSWSNQLYNLNLNPQYQTYNDWNMEKAQLLAKEAFQVNPLPIYTLQEANCLYALKRYNEAHDKYLSLSSTNMKSADIYLYAAQCLQAEQKPVEEVLALMDSALNCFTKPYPVAAANIILMRATTLTSAEKYREAIQAYNEYEHLTAGNVTARFYFEREQLEIKCRMYAAALNDIEKAIKLMPADPVLNAEAASLNYRVGQIEEAISYAQKSIQLDSTFADAYRILGVCYNLQGNKTEAKKHLQHAIELGDKIAEGILQKME